MKNEFIKVILSLLGLCFIFMFIGLIFRIFGFVVSLAVFGFKACLVLLVVYLAYELILYIYNKFKS